MLHDLFINAAILIASLFIGSHLFQRKLITFSSTAVSKILYGIFYGILGSILMKFTLHVTDKVILDLRNIVVILAAIYGGFLPAVLVAAVIGVSRVLMFGLNQASITACVTIFLEAAGCSLLGWFLPNIGAWRKWLVMTVYTGLVVSGAFYVLLADRSLLHVTYFYYWVSFIAAGALAHYFVIFIRRSNLNAEQIKIKQQELQLILDNIDGAVWSVDTASREPGVSMGVEKITGYSRNRLLKESELFAQIIRLTPDAFPSTCKPWTSRPAVQTFEYAITRADGSERWIRNTVTPIYGDHYELVQINGIIVDLTDRKEMEEELRHSREWFSTTLHSIGDGVITTDTSGRVSYMNPIAETLTGWNAAEAKGLPIQDIFPIVHETTREVVENPILAAIRENRIVGLASDTVLISRNGAEIPIDDRAAPIQGEDGSMKGVVLVFRDVLERKRYEEQIRHYAYHDPLTGLPNRRLFTDRLTMAVTNAKRYKKKVAVFFLDLDNFKMINDTLGHDIGDLLLKEAANRLNACMREGDTLSRLGGDEFTVIVSDAEEIDLVKIAERLVASLSHKIVLNGHEMFISPSIGVSCYPDDGVSYEALIAAADKAMYYVKANGKNGYQFYSDTLNENMSRKMKIGKGLREALENNQFTLHYQPKADFLTGRIMGLEALLRWTHPELGSISPAEFIPIAEETGLIDTIGSWVLREACRQHRQWQFEGLGVGRLAVNISLHQLVKKDFVTLVRHVLAETQFDPSRLELEITESVMKKADETIGIIRKLKEMGIYISIDDFGTGYSSLSYLKRLPIDALKIDRSFVQDIYTDPVDAEIVTTIITLAKSLKLHVIAEGVETREQYDYLQRNKCSEAQGYFISKPLDAESLAAFLRNIQG